MQLPASLMASATSVPRKIAAAATAAPTIARISGYRRFGASSYLTGLRARAKGEDFNAKHQLPLQEYAAHGGAFPVRVEGVGQAGDGRPV